MHIATIKIFFFTLLPAILLSAVFFLYGYGSDSPYQKMLKYGDSDIYDYRIFPYRELSPSANTQPVAKDTAQKNEKLEQLIHNKDLYKLLNDNSTLSFLIIYSDTVIAENYFNGANKDFYSQFFSMSKSVISLLVGCAIDDKLINSENDAVTKYLPELKKNGFKNITIADLLSMKAPVNYKESDNPTGKHAWFYYSSTLENDILKLTADEEGEKEFEYRSANTAILGLLLKHVLGSETITQYTQRKLWSPLGMENPGLWNIDHEPGGLERVWCCLAGTAMDFAKIGMLYYNNGTSDSKQIVSNEWIQKTMIPAEASENELAYGLGWWLIPSKDAVIAIGKDGQYTYICPEKRLLIVRIGEDEGSLGREGWLKLFSEISNCF
jgi:CubicO group peptidase (beta-lactamase class C family)